ncbi:hypothetical protein SLS56_011444 [Neofusicoccum ribis]|uniref:Uncharacterized protein n=1 Tax=Neofusicoccum ribis TaxID=45134 RepID=A0ABR3SBN1_9PEZI
MVASRLPGGSTVPVLGVAEDSIDKLLNPDNYVVTGRLEIFIQTPTNTRYWTATSWVQDRHNPMCELLDSVPRSAKLKEDAFRGGEAQHHSPRHNGHGSVSNRTAQKTHVSSLCVSLQQFGAFMVCPMSILISRKYGRKIAVLYHSTMANKSVTPPSRFGRVRLPGLPLDVNTGPPGE